MSLPQAMMLGAAGNKMSKVLTGSEEVSPERTALATGSGAALGATASGLLVIGAGVASPVVVPLTVSVAVISGIMSLFQS